MTLQDLKSKHDRLKKLDGGSFFKSASYKVFGSGTHKYKFNPRLTESQVSGFEKLHHIKLPADYRNFLIEIGDGGSGPAYGILSLQDWNYELEIPDASFLSINFPQIGQWNDSYEVDPEDEDYADTEEYQQWEKEYFSNEHITGSTRVCHYGCAIYYLLIVTGPESGNIWIDDRANGNGLYPALSRETGQRQTFINWFGEWLTESLGFIM